MNTTPPTHTSAHTHTERRVISRSQTGGERRDQGESGVAASGIRRMGDVRAESTVRVGPNWIDKGQARLTSAGCGGPRVVPVQYHHARLTDRPTIRQMTDLRRPGALCGSRRNKVRGWVSDGSRRATRRLDEPSGNVLCGVVSGMCMRDVGRSAGQQGAGTWPASRRTRPGQALLHFSSKAQPV